MSLRQEESEFNLANSPDAGGLCNFSKSATSKSTSP